MNKLSDIDPGPNSPDTVRMVVEIPKNSTNKYEYDSALGVFKLDRALFSPIHYPGDYGFIPGTMSDDGDPADILTLVEEPSFPGCVIEVRPVAILDMIDSAAKDRKILAVPLHNPRYDQIRDMNDIPPHIRREIEHFFTVYKDLEGKKVVTQGWCGREDALLSVVSARQRYLASHPQ